MGDPKNPMPGDSVIDASGLTLVDLTPTQMQQYSKVRDGYEEVFEALLTKDPALLKRAGIDIDELKKAEIHHQNRKKSKATLKAAEKLVELLRETIVSDGYVISGVLTESASQVEKRAKRDSNGPELLASFEPLLDYQKEPSQKALATKEKKADELKKADDR